MIKEIKQKTEPVIIKPKDFQKKSNKITEHIEELLNSRDNLFKNKNYSLSIAISILIIEEMAKLHLIVQHMDSKKPIQKSEWESMCKHKLTNPFNRLSQKMSQIQESEFERILNEREVGLGSEMISLIKSIQKNEEDILKTTKLFDKLKQDYFYVSYKKGKLFSISTDLSVEEQENIAFWIKEHSNRLFGTVVLYFDLKKGMKLINECTKIMNQKKFIDKHNIGNRIFEEHYYK